jgi:hypothetical protein
MVVRDDLGDEGEPGEQSSESEEAADGFKLVGVENEPPRSEDPQHQDGGEVDEKFTGKSGRGRRWWRGCWIDRGH